MSIFYKTKISLFLRAKMIERQFSQIKKKTQNNRSLIQILLSFLFHFVFFFVLAEKMVRSLILQKSARL